MKYPCKVWPGSHKAFPKEQFHWAPLLNVRLIHGQGPPTKWIESWVDSGAHVCIFHASFCNVLGIKLEDGIADQLGGVIGGTKGTMYFHKIKIQVGPEMVTTMAGFSRTLSVAGILGRRGLFDNFIVKIDASPNPPVFEIERIHRA